VGKETSSEHRESAFCLEGACSTTAFASEPPGAGEKQLVESLSFPEPLHPVSSDRALHDRNRVGESQIMHARAKRKRSRAAVLTGKREDTLACLRGAVNGGAEKEKDLELPEKGLYLFMILNSWAVHGLQAALLYPLALEMIRISF
jgi:hypothetical protein